MKKYSAGIDLGGTSIKFGIFTDEGELVSEWKIPTNLDVHGERILSEIAVSLQVKLRELGIQESALRGVGIGIPGIVTQEGAVCTCVNLGWKEKNVKKEMKDLISYKVVIMNDANAAALGEMWKGSGKGFSNIVLITLGTGIGGGIIIGDRIVSGSFGAGGEIGHMITGVSTEIPCGCGRFGCLEQMASATGIVNEMERRIHLDKKYSRWMGNISVKKIFQAADQGDVLALDVIDWAASLLAKAMADISSIIDPEIFILGGGVSEAGEILLEPVTRHFNHQVLGISGNARIRIAAMGNQAGIYGAAKSVMDDQST